jgi:hypothetical protein
MNELGKLLPSGLRRTGAASLSNDHAIIQHQSREIFASRLIGDRPITLTI